MIRKCFTINPLRTKEEILSYEKYLVKTKLFSGCEIFYPYNQSKEQFGEYTESIKEFLKYDDFEIVCHLPHGIKNNIAKYDEEIMQRMKDAIDYASIFNVTKLTLHPGEVENIKRSDAIKISKQNSKILSDYAKQYNMTLMIENLVGTNELCLNIEEMQDYLNSNEDLKLIFDCGHLNVNKKGDVCEFVKTFKDKLYHIHISNNNSLKDEHKSIDEGTIDFVSYFQTLKDIKYTGLYSSEVLFNDYHDLLNTLSLIEKIEKQLK